MNNSKHSLSAKDKWFSIFTELHHIIRNEFKTIFKDRGVVIVFIVASLVYPMLYCGLYKNETLVDVPIAVVNASKSEKARAYVRQIDASPDVKVAAKYFNMREAKTAFEAKEVHGIVYIPEDFDKRLNFNEQANLSIYCDMNSFLYYRALMQAANYTALHVGKEVQLERLADKGIIGESAEIAAEPISFQNNILFNGGMGFASFLMPVILMLIIHQTLFFGIGMLAGTAREENRFSNLISNSIHRGGALRVVLGKSICYFSMYIVFSFYILYVVPRVFNLPHIGQWMDIATMMLPFLLATIFFSMTVSVFLPNRETGMIIFLFFSLILLFLSGVSWPQSNINGFWKTLSWIFPAVHGIQAYIKINSMGADIQHINYEYINLWILTAVYFLTTIASYKWQINKSELVNS